MAKTETGWTKDWPVDADAFYWKRDSLGRYRDLPAHVDHDRVIGLFDHSYTPRGDIEGDIELLGPISPSDFEQLTRLREASLKLIQRFEREYQEYGTVEEFSEVRAVRNALNNDNV